MQQIALFKKRFDPVLGRVLKKVLHSYEGLTQDRFIRETIDYSFTLSMTGGKRVRPYMAWLTYQAFGGRNKKKALETFAGLELFHVFALVHDDIMDHGVERHGVKTAHHQIASRLQQLKRQGDYVHLGVAQAILLGDLLFAWSMNRFAGTKVWPVFRTMVDEVMVGQMIDVDAMTRRVVTDELVLEKMRLKTAYYTFVRPMQIGAVLANAPKTTVRFCETFGAPLGLAFQIQDDLLDLTTSSKQSGKTAFSDLREGNHTVFTQYVRGHGSARQKRALEAFIGAELTEKDRAAVLKLFTESGAIEHGRNLIQAYVDEAHAALDAVKLSRDRKAPFRQFVEYIRSRTN